MIPLRFVFVRRRCRPGLRLILQLLLSVLPGTACADSVRVAVASNFAGPMEEIVEAFEESSPHSVRTSYGSSGKLYAQILHGAPFDVFLSADQSKPDALITKGRALPQSRTTYAMGKLVLWSPNAHSVEGEGRRLKSGDYERIAIANPRHAPYGAAAVDVLEALGANQSGALVYGENIAQTFHFVDSGNLDLGLVALSQLIAKASGKPWPGSYWIVPQHLHPPIRQDAVLLDSAKDSAAARAFLGFLSSAAARSIIADYGYTTTEE